jgi:hypothetical protein
MNRQTDGQTDRADEQTDKQKETDRVDEQTDRWTNRQRQTDRDKQTKCLRRFLPFFAVGLA